MTQLPFPTASTPLHSLPGPDAGINYPRDPHRRASVSSVGPGGVTGPPFASSPSVLPHDHTAHGLYAVQTAQSPPAQPHPTALSNPSMQHPVPPPRRSSTLPTAPAHPSPSVVVGGPPVEDPLMAHHRTLVAYYWHYAQQGYSAPLTAGPGTDESFMQEKARVEAVNWARQCGMDVREVGSPSTASAGGETRTRTASRPLPVAPTPAIPLGAHGNGGTPPIPTASRPSSAVGIGGVRPLPSAPSVPTRSVSLANPPLPAPPHTIPPHRSFSEVQPRTPVSPQFSTDPQTYLERKRPLPAPPVVPSSSNNADAEQLSGQVRDLSLVASDLSSAPVPAPTPGLPLHAVLPATPTIVFDEDRDSAPMLPPRSPSPHPTPPAIPTFAFNDEPDDSSPAPAVPSFSFSVDEGDNSATQPSPLSDRRLPPIHPRDDPSHPSHALYHPTSVSSPFSPQQTSLPSSIEAGTIECTSCRQPIFGRVLMALSRTWHPGCFVCAEEGCGEKLEVMEFEGTPEDWEEETSDEAEPGDSLRGKAWCMVHFEERFALQCYHCHTPISSADYLPITDPSLPPTSSSSTSSTHSSTRYYHPLHFFCAGCGDPFLDPVAYERSGEAVAKPYYVRERHPYCEKCDLRIWRDKCPGCKLGIREEDGYVEIAAGQGRSRQGDEAGTDEKQKWHEGCFKCSMCSKPLAGIYLLRSEPSSTNAASDPAASEKPYCGECFDVVAKEDASATATAP